MPLIILKDYHMHEYHNIVVLQQMLMWYGFKGFRNVQKETVLLQWFIMLKKMLSLNTGKLTT